MKLQNRHSHKSANNINSEEELATNLNINDLKNEIDGSHLTTNNTIDDALDIIQDHIMQNFPDIVEIILTDEKETQNYLKPGNNIIHVGIKPTVNDNIQKIKTIVQNVQEISQTNNDSENLDDESKTIELVKEKFVHGLEVAHLYGWNTIYDALEFFQNEAKKINKNAIISFTDQYLEQAIGENAFKSFSGDTAEENEDFLYSQQLNYNKKTQP